MIANQTFALINDGVVIEVLPFDTYSIADNYAKVKYGTLAYAIDVCYIRVSQGYKFIDGKFYDYDGKEAIKFKTEEEKLAELEFKTMVLNQAIYPTINLELCTLDELKTYWITKIGKVCSKTIYQGIDVETTKGVEHFSLTENDQTNLIGLKDEAMNGTPLLLYHADGQFCRNFSAEEIITIATKAYQHKAYQTTWCNFLINWIRRCTTKEEVQAIEYSSTLPTDLQANFDEIMGA